MFVAAPATRRVAAILDPITSRSLGEFCLPLANIHLSKSTTISTSKPAAQPRVFPTRRMPRAFKSREFSPLSGDSPTGKNPNAEPHPLQGTTKAQSHEGRSQSRTQMPQRQRTTNYQDSLRALFVPSWLIPPHFATRSA